MKAFRQFCFLFFTLLAITAQAQIVDPSGIRIYRVSDQIVIADADGSNPAANPYTSVSVRAYGTSIRVTTSTSTKNYSLTGFLNESGTPYSTLSVNAAINNYLLSVPVSSGGGGSAAATTNAGALTAGTLDDARLSNNVVKITSTYSNPTWLTALDPSRITQNSTNRFSTDAEKDAWNAKQGKITLTTTGTSGAATLVGNNLNIPQYPAGGGSGGLTSPQVAQQIADSLAQTKYNTPLSADFYLDGSGNLRINPAVLAGTLDPTPTQGSTNPVTSGGIYSAMQALLTNTALAGTPTAPTAPASNNSTRVANTEYVDRAVAAVSGGSIADFSVTNAKLANDVKVGSLAGLSTNNKTSVTAAINENVSRINLMNQLPTSDYLLFPNLIMETEATLTSTSTLAVVSGSYYMRRFVATMSGTLTKVGVRVNTPGAGLVADPMQNGIAIYDNAGNRLAIADGSTAWLSSGDKVLTFDVPVTLVAGTTYQMAISGNGSTQPVFTAVPGANMSTFNQTSNYSWYRVQTAGGMASTVSGTIVAGSSVNRPVILGFSN